MKRKLLFALVLVLLAAFMLPLALSTQAQAADDPFIWIDGRKYTLDFTDAGIIGAGEVWEIHRDTVDGADEYTLILNNYSCGSDKYYETTVAGNKTGCYIYSNLTRLTIELKGTNKLGSTVGSYINDRDTVRTRAIYVMGSAGGAIKITGDGTLEVKAYSNVITSSNVTIESKVDCYSYADGLQLNKLSVTESGSLSVTTSGPNLAYRGAVINQAAEIKGTFDISTAGNPNGSDYPSALEMKGPLSVNGGTLRATYSASNSYDDGGRGYGIKGTSIEATNGGYIYASADGTGNGNQHAENGIYASDSITVDAKSTVTGITASNASGIRAKNLKLSNNYNQTAIIAEPAGGYWDSASYSVYAHNGTPASSVTIRGLRISPVYLGTDGGKTAWSYSSSGPWNVYTGDFDLKASGTLGVAGEAVPSVQVVSGSHTMLLDNKIIEPNACSDEPFIELKNGSSLTLKLKGQSYLTSGSTKAVILAPESSDAAACKLIIQDSGDGDGALTVEPQDSWASAFGGWAMDLTINSGVVVATADGGAAFGGWGGHGFSIEGHALQNITVNGGYVTASSTKSSAIGPGRSGGRFGTDYINGGKGTFTINGGTVYARSRQGKAIGGGKGSQTNGKGGTVIVNGGSLNALDSNGDLSIDGTIQNSAGENVYLTKVRLSGTGDGNVRLIQYISSLGDKLGLATGYTLKVSDLTATRYDATQDANVEYDYGTNDLLGEPLYVFLPDGAYAYDARVDGIAERFAPNPGESIQAAKDHKAGGTMYRQYTVVKDCYGIMALRETVINGKVTKQYCLNYNETGTENTQDWVTYDPSTTSFQLTTEGEQNNKGILVISGEHAITLKGVSISNDANSPAPLRILSGKLTLNLDAGAGQTNTLKSVKANGCAIEMGEKGDSELIIQDGGILNLYGYGDGGSAIASRGNTTSVTINSGRVSTGLSDSGIKVTHLTVNGGTLTGGLTVIPIYIDITVITGGSVQGDNDTATGSDGSIVSRNDYVIDGVEPGTKIDGITVSPAGYDYGSDDIYVDENGKIYIWLPAGTTLETVTIGGDTYYRDGDTMRLPVAPVITAPAADTDTYVIENSSVELSVTAAGVPQVTYQWQVDKNDGSGFVDIAGADQAKFTVADASRDQDGWKYRCKADNIVGSATSNEFTLHVYYPAEITQDPQDVSLVQGSLFTFSVTAGGRPDSFSYQWQVDKNDGSGFVNIDGADEAQYSAVASDAEMNGWKFRCAVTNDVGIGGASDKRTAYSAAATLSVEKAYATISQTPDGDKLETGTVVTFSIKTNIENPVYTWYVTRTANSETYVINGEAGESSLELRLDTLASYKVWCVVTGGHDGSGVSVTSEVKRISAYVSGIVVDPVEPGPVDPGELPFKDVRKSDWFYDDVKYVYNEKLMTGTASDMFSPGMTTTRGMIVTVLWRMENSPEPREAAAFDDVASGLWYSKAVAWAAENGIVSGYGNGRFGPNDDITREQFAAILWRYAKYKGYDVSVGEDTNILSYADAEKVSEYAIPAMQWACGAGLIQGDGVNLSPRSNATRSQVAAILHRFCESVK